MRYKTTNVKHNSKVVTNFYILVWLTYDSHIKFEKERIQTQCSSRYINNTYVQLGECM